MYLCACFVERTWRFGLPLVLAFVEGGFQAIAVLGFASPLACSLLGPAVGRALDKVYRPYGLGAMVAAQGLAVALSCLVVLTVAGSTTGVPFGQSPLFGALLLLSMVERLTAVASELAIERDWVTQLSGEEGGQAGLVATLGGHGAGLHPRGSGAQAAPGLSSPLSSAGKGNTRALAKSNAMLRRTDLGCELVGSLLFGTMYSRVGLVPAVWVTAGLAVAFLPVQLAFIYKVRGTGSRRRNSWI